MASSELGYIYKDPIPNKVTYTGTKWTWISMGLGVRTIQPSTHWPSSEGKGDKRKKGGWYHGPACQWARWKGGCAEAWWANGSWLRDKLVVEPFNFIILMCPLFNLKLRAFPHSSFLQIFMHRESWRWIAFPKVIFWYVIFFLVIWLSFSWLSLSLF